MARAMTRTQKHQVKREARSKRVARQAQRGLTPLTGSEDITLIRRDAEPLAPLNDTQANYIGAINGNTLTFGIGPAGTGKTWIACSIAAEMLLAREIDRIILTRPMVDAGERMGFLPGEMMEKVAPYMQPVMRVLERRLGKGMVEALIKSERIEVVPLAFMRGRSLERAFVILDEAQNTTRTQMKMFLTRMEEGCRIVVDGDPRQCDLPDHIESGLSDAITRLEDLNGVGVVRFTRGDIVRSGLVQEVVNAYEN